MQCLWNAINQNAIKQGMPGAKMELRSTLNFSRLNVKQSVMAYFYFLIREKNKEIGIDFFLIKGKKRNKGKERKRSLIFFAFALFL